MSNGGFSFGLAFGFGFVASMRRSTSSGEGSVITILSKAEMAKRDAQLSDAGKRSQVQVQMAVGSYIIAWANIESLLASVLGALLKTGSENAQILHASLSSARAKQGLILALAKANMDDDAFAKIKAILVRFKTETRTRNRLAHSTYSKDAEGAYTAAHFINTDAALEGGELVETTPIDRAWFEKLAEGHRRLGAIYVDLDAIDRAWRAGQPLKP